jgi:quinol monooxygenase YgiN
MPLLPRAGGIAPQAGREAKEPTVFLVYEVNPSQAARDQHVTETLTALRREAGPMPEGILGRPPEVEAYGFLAE